LWEMAVVVLDINEFLLPKPSSIFQALADEWSIMWRAGWETGKIAVTGLVIGIVAGAGLAFLSTRFRVFGDSVTPLAVALNATPIIALAPIFNAWFGITDPRSNQAVVIVVVFFPVFINTARGLVEVAPDQIELMRSYASSEWTIMRRVRVPNALPLFLTSLRVVAPLSVIAAIVAEYFGGPQNRIGPVITQNASFARYDAAWAAIVVGSVVGLGLFVLALLAERLAMPWKRTD
ncbi:MAG: ABC transporter permease subunit, partial [Acidimicrobiia bacterium]|nr:ABC transporter permease subunit [Acidimicrobiia bacterium]